MGTYAKTHVKAGITALSVAVFGASALLSPLSVQAWWPFSPAQAAAGDAPVLHDSSTLQLLAAALNLNPDPNQGGTGLTLSDGSALMAATGPDGSSPSSDQPDTSSDSSSGGNQISVYTVKDGDTITGIASQFGVSVNTILWANGLTIHSPIKPGMTLDILPVTGVEHKVQKGETLSSIAIKYHASASEIATFNGLDAGASISVGDSLIIPGGEDVSTPAPAKSTTKNTASGKKTNSKTVVRSDMGTASSGNGYFENPVPGAILTQGIHGKNAVDLGAAAGTPIHAAAAGTVIISKGDGAWNGGYGSYVVVSHPNGTQTLYSHMSRDISDVGETVSQGEVLGYVGETGEATGNHLHFEVRGARNPFGYSCSVDSACF